MFGFYLKFAGLFISIESVVVELNCKVLSILYAYESMLKIGCLKYTVSKNFLKNKLGKSFKPFILFHIILFSKDTVITIKFFILYLLSKFLFIFAKKYTNISCNKFLFFPSLLLIIATVTSRKKRNKTWSSVWLWKTKRQNM